MDKFFFLMQVDIRLYLMEAKCVGPPHGIGKFGTIFMYF